MEDALFCGGVVGEAFWGGGGGSRRRGVRVRGAFARRSTPSVARALGPARQPPRHTRRVTRCGSVDGCAGGASPYGKRAALSRDVAGVASILQKQTWTSSPRSGAGGMAGGRSGRRAVGGAFPRRAARDHHHACMPVASTRAQRLSVRGSPLTSSVASLALVLWFGAALHS